MGVRSDTAGQTEKVELAPDDQTVPDAYRAVPVESGENVLQRLAYREPDNVYVALSGGTDSITALHFAVHSDAIEIDGALHIDTGFGIRRTTEYVEEMCEKYGVDLITLDNQTARFSHERIETLIPLFGWPGANPIAHSGIRQNLKDKPFGRFEKSLDGSLALISGVRKHESERRYERLNQQGIQEDNGILWASPLVDFTDQDVSSYHDYHEIEENPVDALICASGECMCGSFADRQDLPLIEQFFPEIANRIYQLEWEALEMVARGELEKQYCLWANGSVDSGEYEARTDADQTTLMCSDCEDKCPSQPYQISGDPLSPAEEWLQENHLSEYFNWLFYCPVCDLVVDDPHTHRHEVHPFDEDDGLAGEWDMRMIDVWESAKYGEPITEPSGWKLDPSHITADPEEAERSKHKHYYEDVALSHCDGHDHTWEEYNGGPVKQCADCGAFNLVDYDPEDPGPPTIGDEDTQPAEFEDPGEIQRQLEDYQNPSGV